MALITTLFSARLRTRIIAISQGTFTACHLSGPVVGGMFAAMHWWRGSFWAMAPFMLAFAGLAYARIPDRLDDQTARDRPRAAAAIGDARDRGAMRRRRRPGGGTPAAVAADRGRG